jgi:hypothetical protein
MREIAHDNAPKQDPDFLHSTAGQTMVFVVVIIVVVSFAWRYVF